MGRLTTDDELELMELLPPSVQQAIVRGEVELETILEHVTSTRESELCPRCVQHAVSVPRVGLCRPCYRKAATEAQEEVMHELAAVRHANAIKQRVKRLRDEIDPDRVRRRAGRASSYGRSFQSTDHPLMRACEACGRSFVDRGDTKCPECLNLEEDRHG